MREVLTRVISIALLDHRPRCVRPRLFWRTGITERCRSLGRFAELMFRYFQGEMDGIEL